MIGMKRVCSRAKWILWRWDETQKQLRHDSRGTREALEEIARAMWSLRQMHESHNFTGGSYCMSCGEWVEGQGHPAKGMTRDGFPCSRRPDTEYDRETGHYRLRATSTPS